MDPKDDPMGVTRIGSLALGNTVLTLLLLLPIIAMLFFDGDVPPSLWLGGAWGLVAGILLGWRILRTPNLRQRMKDSLRSVGASQMRQNAVIGIAIGGSGLAHVVLVWWFGENLTLFLVYGICVALVVGCWCYIIAYLRDRSE